MNPDLAARHRRAFLDAIGERGVAVLPTGSERVRSRDTHFPFRPDSDFWYLTAFPEPDAVAVFAPHHDDGPFVLFVNPRDELKEIWNGRRAGVDGAVSRYGADTAYPVEELDERLPALLKGAETLHYATGHDTAFDARVLGMLAGLNARTRDGVLGPGSVADPGRVLHELRLIKSDDELALMRKAAAITVEAHTAAMKHLREGMGEYEIEALINGTFRRHGGWGPGYTTIAAGGDNACVLHYTTNDMTVGEGALLLLDAGCEYAGYTADVTRTFPASGRYSEGQRELYEVVLTAQLAACDAIRPGARFDDVHDVSLRALVDGMIELELLPGTADEIIEGRTYTKYFMHRTSHWLGLDVHDVGSYHEPDGSSRELVPGMVLTVEPGLYVPLDDQTVPERYRGVGIRIEDDVAVTSGGHENLTGATPKTVAEVEAAC